MSKPMKSSFTRLLIGWVLLGVALPLVASARAQAKDVLAKVGDQSITYSEIEIMINSSDLVGMTIPPVGTHARNEARLLLLDKMISANLLYLDAQKNGLQNDPVYRGDIERFSKAILASLYMEKHGPGSIAVNDAEIKDFHKNKLAAGTPLTPDVRISIEARLRNDRLKDQEAAFQKQLRRGIKVEVDAARLDPKGDATRADNEVVARIGDETISWGDVEKSLPGPATSGVMTARADAMNRIIDDRIAADKAKAERLDRDPLYLARMNEYRKVHLISLYKAKLLPQMEPTEREVKDYYEENKDKIRIPESRKIQMVIVKTKAEADSVKKQIDSGKLTIFEAVAKHSIDPNAKLSLGEFGWVAKGTGFPALDRVTFSLKPGELGGPVESEAGWHLVKVLDARDAKLQDINDPETLKVVRNKLLRERRDQYVTGLRTKNVFPVTVYTDTFERIVQQEQENIKASREKTEKTSLAEKDSAGKSGITP